MSRDTDVTALGLTKRKFPRWSKHKKFAPASVQTMPSLGTVSRWSREYMRPNKSSPLGLSYPVITQKRQWHMQKSSRGLEPFLLSPYGGRRQHQEGSSPFCMHTCTKAAEPLRESQQKKGAGVSWISSERRADLPTQRGEPGQWKPPGIEISVTSPIKALDPNHPWFLHAAKLRATHASVFTS